MSKSSNWVAFPRRRIIWPAPLISMGNSDSSLVWRNTFIYFAGKSTNDFGIYLVPQTAPSRDKAAGIKWFPQQVTAQCNLLKQTNRVS